MKPLTTIAFKPDPALHSYPNFLREDAPLMSIKIDFERRRVEPLALAEEVEATPDMQVWTSDAEAIFPIARGINDETLLHLLRRRAAELDEGTSFGMIRLRHNAEAAAIDHSIRYLKVMNKTLTWAFFRAPFRACRMSKTYTASDGREISRLYENYLGALFELAQDQTEELDEPISRYPGSLEDMNVLFVNFLMKKMTINTVHRPWTSNSSRTALLLMENLAAYALLRYLDLLPECGYVSLSMLQFPIHAGKLYGQSGSDNLPKPKKKRRIKKTTIGSTLAI